MLAVTLWFLVTLNTQVFTTTIEVPLKLENFPRDFQLIDELPPYLKVQTKGLGVDLLAELLDGNDTVVINFRRDVRGDYFATRENMANVSRVLQPGVTALRAMPDSIGLHYVRKATKKVPVILRPNTLTLPTQHRLTEPPKIYPESVLITGPPGQLALIEEWPISEKPTDLLDRPQSIFLSLDTLNGVQSLISEVRVEVNPQPYTEDSLVIRVETYPPKGSQLILSPASVTVRYLVPVSRFSDINARQFSITVDSTHIFPSSEYVLPRIGKHPEDVHITEIYPQRLRYSIVREE